MRATQSAMIARSYTSKVTEMKVRELFGGSYFSGVVVGKPLKLRSMFNPSDLSVIGKKPSRQTVTIKNNSTGTIVGKRSIWQA